MKVLITGCKGQLGNELIRQCNMLDKKFELIETDMHNLDITNPKAVFNLLDAAKPDVVINCAAYTNVEGCEKDEAGAFTVNAIGARNLSTAAYKSGAAIVQISTDYVFDGIDYSPKREYDHINPLNIYGKSKALGENLVKETNPRHFIVRTAWLYGQGNNFVKTMLKLSKEQRELNVVGDQIGTPTSTVDLSRCIIDLIETECFGTYHASCEGQCSWYEFAVKIFQIAGINISINNIMTEQLNRPVNRPKFSVLENFSSGHEMGLRFTYRVQDQAGGIAQALSLAEGFVGTDRCVVILGDNIFEDAITSFVCDFEKQKNGSKIVLKEVYDPQRYGVAKLHDDYIEYIEEKPLEPKSNYCVTGIYMYDSAVFKIINTLKPSKRGELEITDVNNEYIRRGNLTYSILSGWWTDAGTFESLSRANALSRNFYFKHEVFNEAVALINAKS